MEFHISKKARDKYDFDQAIFSLRGPVIFYSLTSAREFGKKIQTQHPGLRYQDIFAMGLIDEILHFVLQSYGKVLGKPFSQHVWDSVQASLGEKRLKNCVRKFAQQFPPSPVYRQEIDLDSWLDAQHDDLSGWAQELEEMLMLWIENQNPAFEIAKDLFDDSNLEKTCSYSEVINEIYTLCSALPFFGPENQNLVDMLRAPAMVHPHSLDLQLEYIQKKWGNILGDLLARLLRSIDYLKEVNAYFLRQGMGSPGKESKILEFHGSGNEEYERFSPDRDWMPRVVMLAKTTLVWLDQLSKKYGAAITRLDQIPDEELDGIAGRGFNSLWLIGLWKRSDASRKIKHRCGNPDAAASAYALYDYDIADEIGAWAGLENLRWRAWNRGIRLASDMVPNHTGIESTWVLEHPDWYVQSSYPPYSSYTFNSENLSDNQQIGLYLEDHYYNQSDAAVVFKRVDHRSGDTRYIYHGNDGTHMPWNDTAQLNFLKAEVREAVIQTIVHVAKNFPIIRFDAAMTLAKRHIQRLWFPEPGHGGDIPSRSEHGMSAAEFNAAIPQEFWREVVDRCAVEAPDTLLLAEAFWMMEGYFVRTLGMHRVYNSAFMNMLKAEENAKYRQTIKNTISFDKDILKRFVNFMNNPDEETAEAQFGKGDKYFGVCTLMATMPGLPMFGHGQIEGYTEKYGMEYRRAYKEESEDQNLIERHYREIFPLLKKRYLFAGVDSFYIYDLNGFDGSVNENVFAYSNTFGPERCLILYNNNYEAAQGTIKISVPYAQKTGGTDKQSIQTNLGEGLGLKNDQDSYCLMREQRSNLWYIRRSSDICEHGLGIILNGYQSQIYLEINEVADNAYRHYRQLHDHLGGAGTQDIQEAIKELVLGPIYDSFAKTLGPEWWKAALDLVHNVKRSQEEFDLFSAGLHAFIEQTSSYSPDQSRYLQIPEKFESRFKNFCTLFDSLKNLDSPKTEAKLKKAAHYILDQVEKTDACYRVICMILLNCLGEENEEWGLQYKVAQIGDFRYQVGPLSVVLSMIPSGQNEAHKNVDILDALTYMELQEFLQVNYYDGVRWFNRERFIDLVWWSSIWILIDKSEFDPEHMQSIVQRNHEWLKLMEKSDYKFDELKAQISISSKRAKPVKKKDVKPGEK